ncbi:MAG: DUF4293 domain-containing protein [Bacteroidales bacterium]|nr:DUF4293 domain-containing protein [Bacteroidales bacterium]MCD8393247.1 DUF4293 domain-containing protein [Bacteroidales bacterium]
MVIQRWQSVLLLVAALCMGGAAIFPLGPMFLVISILVAVLLFLAIFMFKNLRRQRLVTLISSLLIIVTAFVGVMSMPAFCFWPLLLMLVALVCAAWAYRRIGADDRLLRSADRIR